jgi:RNA polymerase sigma factor (sigma-70 family)
MVLDALARQGGRDPAAAVVVEYADMVYATCRRVLGNEAEAADVAQETFFHFLQNAGRIRGSVGAWLHHVATSRSIDLVRRNSSRRRREEAYMADTTSAPDSWHELEPVVDEALEALPAESRDLLVEHFLQRRGMAEMGAKRGLSQPTVSRRVAAALEELRGLLRDRGVVLGAAGLGSLFQVAVESAPVPLMQSLGKMVLAHTAAGLGGAATSGWGTVAVGMKVVGVTAVLVALIGPVLFRSKPPPAPAPVLTNALPTSVTFGFATSAVWTTGPGGRVTRLVTSGTNFAVTNFGGAPSGAVGASPRPPFP